MNFAELILAFGAGMIVGRGLDTWALIRRHRRLEAALRERPRMTFPGGVFDLPTSERFEHLQAVWWDPVKNEAVSDSGHYVGSATQDQPGVPVVRVAMARKEQT
jgi:hypothetical protein